MDNILKFDYTVYKEYEAVTSELKRRALSNPEYVGIIDQAVEAFEHLSMYIDIVEFDVMGVDKSYLELLKSDLAEAPIELLIDSSMILGATIGKYIRHFQENGLSSDVR